MTAWEIVQAHLAAEELANDLLPFQTAAAVRTVRSITRDVFEIYVQKEGKLADQYAKKDEKGNLILDERGNITVEGRGAEFLAKREELRKTDMGENWPFFEAPAPERIKPSILDALSPFITFS